MGSVIKRIRKDGSNKNIWYIVYPVNGRRKWEAVGEVGKVTKTMARELLKKREQQVKLGQWDMIENKVPTLSEFVPDYINYIKDVKQNRTWKKSQEHLIKLQRVFGNKKLFEITPKDIDTYKARRVEEVSPTTVNRELEVLSNLFNIAERWKKFFGKNPVSAAGLFKLENQIERILTLEEEQSLLANCAEHVRPIIKLALYTGMRMSEILTLTWEDIDFNNDRIVIKKEVSKNKKKGIVLISSKARKLLLKQKLKSESNKYVFTYNGKPIKNIRRAFEKARKRTGIEDLRFHDLRHTAATRMIESNVGIVAVSKILRHSDIRTTMRYVHPDDSLRDAVEKLANFESGKVKVELK